MNADVEVDLVPEPPPLLELRHVSRHFVKPLDLPARIANLLGAGLRDEVVHAVADHSKVEQVFGYKAEWSLADGLTRMAEWARQCGPTEPGKRFDVELTKNLPASWAR